MTIDLTDEESAALVRELDRIIKDDRYFLSPRIQTLSAIRDKLKPPAPSPTKPFPLSQPGDGPRAAVAQRRRQRRG
jgi:hypothetical protein